METFDPKCAKDEVILITSALYGRMERGRCAVTNYGHIGCQSDVTAIAKTKCSARWNCTITVPDRDMEAICPCPTDLQKYLSISYSCLKGNY